MFADTLLFSTAVQYHLDLFFVYMDTVVMVYSILPGKQREMSSIRFFRFSGVTVLQVILISRDVNLQLFVFNVSCFLRRLFKVFCEHFSLL